MFIVWLHHHRDLNLSLSLHPTDWVELHLYSARIGVPQLQNATMDILQDLYVQRDWFIVSSDIVELIFADSGSESLTGLRKWCVAMATSALLRHQCGAAEVASVLRSRNFSECFLSYLQHSAQYRPGISLLEEDPRQRELVCDRDSDFLRLPSGFPRCYFHSHWVLECLECNSGT